MPQQLFGAIEDERRIVICDLEAGVGAIVHKGEADLVLVVAEPSVKSIDVARRAAAKASEGNHFARMPNGSSSGNDSARMPNGSDPLPKVIVVANRVRDEADLDLIAAALGDYEIVVVPDDPAIALADEQGRAPIDVDPAAPGVAALLNLAERLGPQPVAA